MSRPARARIDLEALRHNYLMARSMHGNRALAVLKADAYGHGAEWCAQALHRDADGFAVAFVEEALRLRIRNVRRPILVLEGPFDVEDVRLAVEHELWLVVHQQEQITMIERCSIARMGLTVWLKADTGMHRAGFSREEYKAAYARLMASKKIEKIVLMTHFSRADEPLSPFTMEQIAAFDDFSAGLECERSLCNSAGTLAWAAGYGDWSRPGIMLYGVDPISTCSRDLKPVMTLESEVFAVRHLQPGDSLGYGGAFIADRPMRVGLVAMGYADGYPRRAGTGTPVAVGGVKTRIVGRVSMDMLTVDLADRPDAGVGSRVELWGNQIDVNCVATSAGTIAYELLCNVKRVPKVYEGVEVQEA